MTEDTGDAAADLPQQRWVTMEADRESPAIGGHEAWGICICGNQIGGEPFEQHDRLECSACGRAYSVQFEQLEGATRKHPMCPSCHTGMTRGSGYWCPECSIDIASAHVDTYDDVLREYQIREWTLELTEACGSAGGTWHTHGGPDAVIRHCQSCCPHCPCACETTYCDCDHTGQAVPDPRYDYTDRVDLYCRLREAVGECGRFDCDAEHQARALADETAD